MNPGSCDCTLVCADAGTQPIACTWAKPDPCPAGMFCNAQSCGAGTCVDKLANETSIDNPQCGCDGITYFNPTVAAKNGMAIRANGACANDAVSCGGPLPNNGCPNPAQSCNREAKNKEGCMAVEPTGVCWMMPAACNVNLAGEHTARACSGSQCADICSAIKSQATWFEDGSCAN